MCAKEEANFGFHEGRVVDPDPNLDTYDPYSMYLGLPDPHPDPLVTSTVRILPSSNRNSKKNLDFYWFFTFL
jgi:hypothetical protein